LGSGSIRGGDEVGGFGEYHLIDTAGYQMEGNDGEKTSALVGLMWDGSPDNSTRNV
jgi:hypothetical protein